MIERRQSVRVECEIPSSFRDLASEQPGRIENATVRNISQGGVKIRVDEIIPIQSSLYLYIPLPAYQYTVGTQAIPIWVVRLPREQKYEVGVRFVRVEKEDEEAIQRFQYRSLLEKIPMRHNVVKDLLKNIPEMKEPPT